MDWTITITTEGPGTPASTDQVEALAELLAPHAGIVTGTPTATSDRHIWGATITLDISDPYDAIRKAGLIIEAAARQAELDWHGPARLELLSDAELDRELAAPDGGIDLVGIKEVAAMLDITPQRASMLQTKGDFPHPIAKLGGGPVWRRHDIAHWATTWTRAPGRPRKAG